MKIPNTVIEQLRTKYSEQTVKQAKTTYNRICKLMKNIEQPSDLQRNECLDLIACLDTIPLCSRSVCTSMVISILKADKQKVMNCLTEYLNVVYLQSRRDNIRMRHIKKINSNLDSKKMCDFFCDIASNVPKRYSKITFNEDGKPNEIKGRWRFSVQKSNRAVLYSILNDMPCRLTEFASMGFNDEYDNYIDLKTNQMIIRKQKSSNRKRIIELSDHTIDIIKFHILNTGSDYLFHKGIDPKTPMNASNINDLYFHANKFYCKEKNIEYVPKQMGIHSLRACKETHNLEPLLKDISEEQMLAILDTCEKMGHGFGTAVLSYYRQA